MRLLETLMGHEPEAEEVPMKDQIEAAQLAATYNHELVTDPMRTGHFYLDDTITDENARPLARELVAYGRLRPGKPILLDVYSDGGVLTAGWMLYDVLRTLADQEHPVTTRVRGVAASMAVAVYLAGDTRIVGPRSSLMIHEPSNVIGGQLGVIKDDAQELERQYEHMKHVVCSRTGIESEYFEERVHRRAWWMDATEAIAMGIAHEVG